MVKLNNWQVGLLIVFTVAVFFRFWKLSDFPVSLSMDEVSIGNNAYSILKTGRDEWGMKLPLYFKSVGDYKPPVNVYLTILPIFLFGLSEFSVRFVSALVGAMTSVIIVLLLREMGFRKSTALFGGFWVAINPWHVHFSRASFEAVTALFFVILGLLIFLKGIRRKSHYLLGFGGVLLSISMWTYHAERLFTPVLVLFLLVNYRQKLKFIFEKRKKLLIVVGWNLLLLAPLLYVSLFTPAIKTRALSTSILRDQSLVKNLHNGEYLSFGEFVFDNDVYLIFRHFLGKYLNYYDLRFWFWDGLGMTPKGYPGMGLFYTVDLVIILVGIRRLFVDKKLQHKKLMFFWFFVGPVSAALTMNEQHSLRALIWLPVFVFTASLGFEFLTKRRRVYFGILVAGVLYFGDMYFRQYPFYYSEYWQYGHKDIALWICENKENFNEIIVTDTFGSEAPINTGIPYAYVLFYCKEDPLAFFENGRKIKGVSFRRVDWKNDSTRQNTALIGSRWDINPNDVHPEKLVKVTKFKNGKEAFVYTETN